MLVLVIFCQAAYVENQTNPTKRHRHGCFNLITSNLHSCIYLLCFLQRCPWWKTYFVGEEPPAEITTIHPKLDWGRST